MLPNDASRSAFKDICHEYHVQIVNLKPSLLCMIQHFIYPLQDIGAQRIRHWHSFNLLTLGNSFAKVTGNRVISEVSSHRYVTSLAPCSIYSIVLFLRFLMFFSSWSTILCSPFCSPHFPFTSDFFYISSYYFKREEVTECMRNLWLSALLRSTFGILDG